MSPSRLLVAALTVLVLGPAPARAEEFVIPVDPCSKYACRELTKEEQAKLGRVMSKLMNGLPTPETERYEQTGLKSMQGQGAVMVTDPMWQASSFPANIVDTMALGFGKDGAFPRSFMVIYSYALKDQGTREKLGLKQGFHKTAEGEMEVFDLRIEASAWPVPAPVDRGSVPVGGKGTDIFERRLAGDEQGTSRVSVIVGPKANEKDTPEGVPPARLAPVKAVKVVLQGPRADVIALAKKINRAALKGLIGPIDKVIAN